jgi:ADP-ribose pyrophosphatase YjhB (NUDIX family)
VKQRWFSSSRWKSIQESVPITCVDVLPVRFAAGSPKRVNAVGLILRETPHEGKRWCLVGGRLLYGESLEEAIHRQIKETLGSRVHVAVGRDPQPLYVKQYSPRGRSPFSVDPRQHSVGLTYASQIKGTPVAGGEAISFKWFDVTSLPKAKEFGFGQDTVVRICLQLLGSCSR